MRKNCPCLVLTISDRIQFFVMRMQQYTELLQLRVDLISTYAALIRSFLTTKLRYFTIQFVNLLKPQNTIKTHRVQFPFPCSKAFKNGSYKANTVPETRMLNLKCKDLLFIVIGKQPNFTLENLH